MAYEIVPWSRELEPGIVQLQSDLWGPDATRRAAYFQWKYLENPYLERPLIQLALADGQVVAMRGMFGSLWEVDDPAIQQVFPCADDFFVAPDHRNRGVAARVMRASTAEAGRLGFPYALSLTAGPVTFVNSLASGWRSVGGYSPVGLNAPWSPEFQRLRSLVKRIRSGLPGNPAPVEESSGPFSHLDGARRRISAPLSLSRDPRPKEMEDLVARLAWDGRIRHVRNAQYFAWRFRNPLHDYRFLFWQGDRLGGYLVLQRYLMTNRYGGVVNIADWEAETEQIGAALLTAAVRLGRFPRIQTWTAGMAAPVRALLHARGFKADDTHGLRVRSQGLLVHRLDGAPATEAWSLGGRALLHLSDWDFRKLYSMAA